MPGFGQNGASQKWSGRCLRAKKWRQSRHNTSQMEYELAWVIQVQMLKCIRLALSVQNDTAHVKSVTTEPRRDLCLVMASTTQRNTSTLWEKVSTMMIIFKHKSGYNCSPFISIPWLTGRMKSHCELPNKNMAWVKGFLQYTICLHL